MNPGYQQQQQMPQQGYQQPMAQAAPPAGGVAGLKKNPILLVSGILLGLFVLCNWLVGAFKIDGDGGRFLSHTGTAMGTAALGLLMLTAFHRLTEKDKEYPANVGVGIVICVLLLAVVGLGSLLHLR